MRLRVPIGIDDFRALREQRLEYVDKSHLIRDLIDMVGTEVVLLPRPRRFGKTMNLSMLRCFFEKRDEDLTPLFEDLTLWSAGEAYRAHFQRYPVIHLTLKDLKFLSWDACWDAIKKKITMLYGEHRAALERLTGADARWAREILEGTASLAVYAGALGDLSRYLHGHYGERVVILIDEYDEPIHAGYVYGYHAEAVEFFRAFLTGGLKGNAHLFKAVLSGILRVARESIFSGLNNIAVFSLLRPELSTCFGFTEPEVERLLERAGRLDRLEDVRSWYNGYLFGREVLYNPWSILNFVASADGLLRNYWVATSSNDLVQDLLEHHALALDTELEALLAGSAIERWLDESVVLADLRTNEGALWSLLVMSGYLKAEPAAGEPGEVPPYRLSIPNREVREVYLSTFRGWIASRLLAGGGSVERLTASLLRGDAEAFERQLQAFVTTLLSYHDPGSVEPERVYHAFLVGLLATLEPEYQVRSNRESGYGRPDVMIRPAHAGKPGVVLELKVARPPRRTLEAALEEGVEQIRQGDYAAEFRASGIAPVHAFAVAFDGKSIRVQAAG